MQDRSVSGKVAYCHRLATAGLKLCIYTTRIPVVCVTWTPFAVNELHHCTSGLAILVRQHFKTKLKFCHYGAWANFEYLDEQI